jgi:hypothetical protein
MPLQWKRHALQSHVLAHILIGKSGKSDVSDSPSLVRRYRVNPTSVPTVPGYALTDFPRSVGEQILPGERQKIPSCARSAAGTAVSSNIAEAVN